jgi:hypothetical protein
MVKSLLLLALLITGTAQAYTYKDHLIEIFCTAEKRVKLERTTIIVVKNIKPQQIKTTI